METLTERTKNGVAVYKHPTIEPEGWKSKRHAVIEKCCYYEDMEERLEKVYGEFDGMIETIVSHLEKHEGVDVGSPGKALLLTDDDVDKWKKYMTDGWIPVLERLPDNARSVLICDANGCIHVGWWSGKRWWTEFLHDDVVGNIISWQPLPDPYNPKKGEE